MISEETQRQRESVRWTRTNEKLRSPSTKNIKQVLKSTVVTSPPDVLHTRLNRSPAKTCIKRKRELKGKKNRFTVDRRLRDHYRGEVL